MEKKKQSIVH
ncbi:Protein of unknown function [Bacillus wiedmannii]|uniref:Uncharacterized protein n=1 Tax=Bacillus wiedmannii TaxID=1890302 RepID=A0A1C4A1B7_9BACI|nr:Protein of unknown function [Bacillus mobilis]SCB88306.1 Protein of unknown function [Bacillus wiedmannii]SCN04849.1 Protein of unknown function [Bacillus wiedmannii]